MGGSQNSALYLGLIVYIIFILPHNFPGIFHDLPCYQDQECRGLGGFCTLISIYLDSREREREESIDTKIVVIC